MLLSIFCATLCTPTQAQNVDTILAEADRLYDQFKWDAAIVKFDEALRLKPELYASLYLRGTCWLNKGDLDRALADYNSSLRIMPTYAYALNGRGVVYMRKENFQAALTEYTEAIRCDPKLSAAYLNRAGLNIDLQNFDAAIRDYSRMIEINRANANAFWLRAKAWERKNEWDNVIKDYRQALRLQPLLTGPCLKTLIEDLAANSTVPALFDAIGWLQATSSEKGARDGKKAVLAAKAACEMTEYKNWAFLATLSAAYAEAGDFENAVTWAYGALDIAPEAEKRDLLERAKLFENRQPYRDVLKNNASAEGFIPLFNGKDLTGWSVEGGKPEQWSVAGSEIVGRSDSWRTRCHLLADKEYEDYVLRFEFRIEGSDGRGGVAVRGILGENAPLDNRMVFAHPIIMLRNGKKENESTGTTHWMKNADSNVPPLITLELAPGSWNRMEVTIRGDHCGATVGDKSVVDIKLDPKQPGTFVPGLARSHGKVGFQINTGVVRFRKIEIKELPVNPK